LLLEFQSQPDKYMALRIMTYVGLLYQDLIKMRGTDKGIQSEKLPPVMPIVLYNGEQKWNAAEEMSELIEEVPGGLSKYRPQARYLLLEESRLVTEESASLLPSVSSRRSSTNGSERCPFCGASAIWSN
jgi:hypothetical protein